MIMTIVWILFYMAFPALVLSGCRKNVWLDKIGGIVLCYGAGILLGNIGILPDNAFTIQDTLTTIVIPLALPLIFFSMDLHGFRKQTVIVLRAFGGALISVAVATVISFFLFRQVAGEEGWKAAGMLVGVYTGGTPNMAAIGMALEISSERYLAIHGSDVIVCGVLFFLLISIIPRIMRRWLPSPPLPVNERNEEAAESNRFEVYFSGFRKKDVPPLAGAFALAVLIFGVGGGISLLIPDTFSSVVAILIITSLGVACSFIRRIRAIRYTFQLGFYLLMVFSLVVSSMADIRVIGQTAPMMMAYVATMLLITLILHALLARLFKVDTNTYVIVATAMIYSPPFVPVVAAALKDRKVIMAGMLTGIAGWILGNYLGIGIAYLLRLAGS